MNKLDFILEDAESKLRNENIKIKEENRKLKEECSTLQTTLLKNTVDISNLQSMVAQLQQQVQLIQLQIPAQGQGSGIVQPGGVWRYPYGDNITYPNTNGIQYTVNSDTWHYLGSGYNTVGSSTVSTLSASSTTYLNNVTPSSFTAGYDTGTNKELTLNSSY